MLTAILENAILKHQQGNLQEASSLYQQILQQEPNNIDALRLLSILAEQAGQLNTALELARKAVSIQPRRIELHLNLANHLLAANRTDEAIETIRKASQIDKRNFEVLFLLADACQQKGDLQSAIDYYKKALQQDRSVPELYNNMANAWLALGEYREAVTAYRKAISLKADYADAYFNLGNACRELEQHEDAVSAYRKALDINPGYHRAYGMLGVAYKQAGRAQEALDCYGKALQLLPPDSPERAIVLYNLGNLYQDARQYDKAAVAYQQALALQPDNYGALRNLANTWTEQGKVKDVLEIYKKLSDLFPENPAYRINQALSLPVIYDSHEDVVAWHARYEAEVDKLLQSDLPSAGADFFKTLATTGFYLAYQGYRDKELQIKVAQVFRKLLGEPSLVLPENRTPNPKPKIGFISRHLSHNHTIGKLLQGIILNLSRELFDVVIFSIGTQHAYRKTGQEHPSDTFYEFSEHDFDGIKQALWQENLDVLYFTDIGMDPMTYLLAHFRFAPVQCTTWGHPVTTGSLNMDYFISTQFVEPEDGSDHYSETLVPLEAYPFYYYRPTLETFTLSKADLGVSDSQNLYVCPQTLFKLHPDTDAIFGDILRRDPDGVIMLLSHFSTHCNEQFMQRFSRHYPDVADRIRFVGRLPRDQFISLMAIADVMLDTIHFSGGNTSYEGLAFGTPIITLNNPYMKGRLTVGLYKKMGLTDCIADTPEEYVNLALRYGTDPEARKAMREEILRRCDCLYEDMDAVRRHEEFFLRALKEKS